MGQHLSRHVSFETHTSSWINVAVTWGTQITDRSQKWKSHHVNAYVTSYPLFCLLVGHMHNYLLGLLHQDLTTNMQEKG